MIKFIISAVIFLLAFYSYQYIDKDLALYFHNLQNSRLKEFVSSFTFLGESQWYIVTSLILYIIFKTKQMFKYAQMALYLFVTNIVAGIGVWLIKIPCGRFRPNMLFNQNRYGFDGLSIHYNYVSFPSGHSITIFSTATALALLFPKYKIVFFTIAILVAFSRVTVGAHYFSDVLIGSYLGVVISLVLYKKMILENRFE